MTKPQIIEIVVNKLKEDSEFKEYHLQKLENLLNDILPEEDKNPISILINYSDYIFKQKWGKFEIFIDNDVTPHVRVKISTFLKKYNLEVEVAKQFIKWLNENIYSKLHRKMRIWDLYDEKLYDIYLNRDKVTEKNVMEVKKQIGSKRILTAE